MKATATHASLTVDLSWLVVHLCMRSATLTTIAPGRGGAGTYSVHPSGKTCQVETDSVQ